MANAYDGLSGRLGCPGQRRPKTRPHQGGGPSHILVARSAFAADLYVPVSSIANVEHETIHLNLPQRDAEQMGWEQAPRDDEIPAGPDDDLHRHIWLPLSRLVAANPRARWPPVQEPAGSSYGCARRIDPAAPAARGRSLAPG